jgi:aryl-alcohol dehydrogenase-like predicted oxidoreductase
MEYRPFGQTGIDVSAIGFGCWEMGGSYGAIDESDIVAAVNRGIDLGINCFDTAQGYGMGASERLLARALGNRRNEVILVTKFGIGYEQGRDSSVEMVHKAIDQSLEMLNTDYIDVYLVHWPDRDTPFEETMGALEEIVQAGKVRHIGLSNFTPDEIRTSMDARRVDVLQYGYNMFDRRQSKWIFPYAQEQNIGIMTYGSLAYGLLAGVFNEDTVFEGPDWRKNGGGGFSLKLFAPGVFQRNVQAVNEIKAIADGLGKSLPHLALNWVLSHPAVSTALVGARTVAEVDDNMNALGWTLTDDVKREIDRVFAKYEIDTMPDKWVENDKRWQNIDPTDWV